jgi:hypothetical protein
VLSNAFVATDLNEPGYLPGLASVLIRIRAWVVILCGGVFVFPLAFESKTGSFESAYIAIFAGLIFTFIAVGLGIGMYANRKRGLEIDAGYVFTHADAEQNPQAFWVTPKSKVVLSRPLEERPPRGGHL